MSPFSRRCGAHDAAACQRVLDAVRAHGVQRVRIGWADWHGLVRAKALLPAALPAALDEGIGLVSTLMLKDSADRTALPVFEPGALDALPGFGPANNLVLLPDPASFVMLPWAPATAWLRGTPHLADGRPVAFEPRQVLQAALAALAATGHTLRVGLEVEFHVYRITAEPGLDPHAAAWPGEPPEVQMLHPGYQLLGEAWADRADEVMALVQHTALGLGLPLRSLEIELGPSQFEAVFDATDALTAADQMILFRSGVKQALRRAGYHASFVCRPPFAQIMSSGWHLHQSLLDAEGRNAFVPDAAAGEALSPTGRAWLAGLLAHAAGSTPFAVPTLNGYARFQPNAMAPVSVCWGRDHRGAMLRVLGGPGDAATRIENRLGEPLANPYLYLASQVHAGLDGLRRGLVPPPPAESPDARPGTIPPTLADALAAFEADAVLVQGFGAPLAQVYGALKRHEISRHAQADDSLAWQRREYFSRY